MKRSSTFDGCRTMISPAHTYCSLSPSTPPGTPASSRRCVLTLRERMHRPPSSSVLSSRSAISYSFGSLNTSTGPLKSSLLTRFHGFESLEESKYSKTSWKHQREQRTFEISLPEPYFDSDNRDRYENAILGSR